MMLSAVNIDGVWSYSLAVPTWFLAECQHCYSKDVMHNWTLADISPHPTTVDRTFPSHPYFTTSFQDGQKGLYNVLHAYSVADEEVGYCQGMSYIAGIFLIHVSLNVLPYSGTGHHGTRSHGLSRAGALLGHFKDT